METLLMEKDQIDLLHSLIINYNSSKNKEEKVEIRNEIYLKMLPYIKKWISSILAKRGIFLEKEEIISKSWDCFEFCIKHFRPEKNISVPSHFYSYTNFYLKTYEKINNKNISDQEFEIRNSCSGEDNLYGQLDELKSFKEMLSEEYAFVFDDALMSLIPENKNKQYRPKQSNLPIVRYKEAKKIFKIVIDFLIRR